MKTSKLSQFDDIRVILDAALAAEGGNVELPDHKAAIHWRLRAYRFRRLFAETVSISPYEKLSFPRIEPGSNIVKINIIKQAAIFHPAGESAPDDEVDPLLEYAKRLAAGDDDPVL